MPGYCYCDLDEGDMFLNFLLHEYLKQMSGVDIRHVRSVDPDHEGWEAARLTDWERWGRNWMELTELPYRSIQPMIRLKMDAYGDKTDIANPFHWVTVRLNLPGKKGYRSDLPWVMKIRWDGHLAWSSCMLTTAKRRGFADKFAGQLRGEWLRFVRSTGSRINQQNELFRPTSPTRGPGRYLAQTRVR